MLVLLSRFWFSLRFALLTATVLLVLGLNQRAVSILRLPAGKGDTRLAARPKATVIKQKVLLEAAAAPDYFLVPPAGAGVLPAGPGGWQPALRTARAVAQLPAGVHPSEFFRARLLAVSLSPQAP